MQLKNAASDFIIFTEQHKAERVNLKSWAGF